MKANDIVICINNKGNKILTIGEKYKIMETFDNCQFIRLKGFKPTNLFYKDRFILYTRLDKLNRIL